MIALIILLAGLALPASAARDLVILAGEILDPETGWTHPGGAVRFGEDGLIRPDSIRKDINAMLDAPEFEYLGRLAGTGGIRTVGTSEASAALAIDGDTATAWLPGMDDPVDSWWIELDTGREVLAKKLRLVFGADGPPFGDFKVYVSDGATRPATKLPEYRLVHQTVARNEEQIVEIPLPWTNERGEILLGRPIQMAKVVFDKKVEGASLAEAEVWTVGDNIAMGTLERGGSVLTGKNTGAKVIFDGVVTSQVQLSRFGNDWISSGNWIRLDLGTSFWIEHLFLDILSGMPGYQIHFSDGTESILTRTEEWQVEGRNLEWQQVVDHDNKDRWPRHNDFTLDPPAKARYVFWYQFHGTGAHVSGAFFSEFMLFGEGFLPAVTLTSEVIATGGGYVTALDWVADTPPGTRVLMRSRSGDAVIDTSIFKDNKGKVVTEDKWNSLPKSFKGPVTTKRLPIEEEWSGWTPLTPVAGQPFPSPSPTDFVQLEVRLESDDPGVAAGLESVILRQADPLVKAIFGRIEPRVTRPDSLTRFTCFLQPQSSFGDPGFDRILIRAPDVVDSVEVRIDGSPVPSQVIANLPDSVVIEMETPTRFAVEASFKTRLERDNTLFEGAVANGESPWQRVRVKAPGLLTVQLPAFSESDRLIKDLGIAPGVFTPNGDAVNDEAVVRFILLKVDALRDVQVDLFDLGGRRVRRLHDEAGISGVYEIPWDGTDDAGQVVPPGLYLARILVDGDAGDKERAIPVSVAY